ncbi:ABC-2 type transport system permease protein [Streptoalloteichus tenebrarius]|uniref:ABC-2 type transport system permease protein n=1 Tax=Streptoalloteichus tenebrarius (strain ATCC 17920 / DSM 40477 / JCM 4838 / CBS 697.72 / NBRC 16177 / NCIMB 11028 / NRRL B-12390 / A12253. 1 / ISP 5477) TaxID=1933 RepID=A0ABT1I3S2_STRSD|nr:ABC transporter permease [Streptoalloteichus tenebrarius]MCP2262440.1 ABC-2 type transport system permease protein [Streptoalloteichus tenebrarius]BFF00439.1 ABC transporter permease [Streptoalloteichus tenebrarius]
MNARYLALEAKRTLRNAKFLVFTIGLPTVLFLFYANMMGDGRTETGVSAAALILCNMAAYGGMSAAVMSGVRVASERALGWHRQLRLTPLSGQGYLVVKGGLGLLTAVPGLVLISVVAAFAADVHLSAGQWAQLLVGVWLALIPFALLGLFLGHVGSAESSPVISGGVLVLLGMFGGLFIPAQAMPGWLAGVAKALPTYWLSRVGQSVVEQGVVGVEAVLVLLGWTVVLGLLVARWYVRDSARA